MRRILALIAVGVLGFFLAVVVPHRVLAQQAKEAPAPANIEPGRLGVELRALSEPAIEALGLNQAHAVLVVFPIPGGPADGAGLRPGDVIVEMEGAAVGPLQGFIAALQRQGAGNVAALGLLRGKERLTVRVTLARAADIRQDADHAERKIQALEAILQIVDYEAFRQDWSALQFDLGGAYWSRARGDRADNMEKAIAAYEAALTARTREALPQDWAATQHNLGGAYWSRIHGDRAENLEKAIAAYEAALTVTGREALPHGWAETQSRLGNAYWSRIRGDRADNLERAISAYEAALKVRTREALPREWAETQNNLGGAFWSRIRGDRADNMEKAVAAYEAALTVRTREALPQDWAATQHNLGGAYWSRIQGDRADNVEKAIAAYEAALTVRTREALPHDWAAIRHNLGNAYWSRIHGDRADNVEKAIAAYEAALTVRTHEALPREWAETQNNLGGAYWSRIHGNRADNMEKAIAAYQATLTVRTRSESPREWAITQNQLGSAHLSRVLGDRADNLEKAIAHHEAALTVFTRETFAGQWAHTQRNLGSAYTDRIRGAYADNQEKAIAHHEAALTVFTREAFPEQWAHTQNDLGDAFWCRCRARGDRADNLERAIAHHEAALTVFTRAAFPEHWASSQHNLGDAYADRIRGVRAENLEVAIEHYQAALTVRTREAFPESWSWSQRRLADVYTRRIRGERAENLEKGISYHEAALTVATRETFPHAWASIQSGLGLAYGMRIRGERADNLEKAIAHFEAALTVTTREAAPREYLETARDLGNALIRKRDWHTARRVHAEAREAFLLLFGQGLEENEARDLIEQAGPLFSDAAYAATERGEFETALALINEGRARQLRVALRLQAIELPPDKRPRHAALRTEIREWSRLAEGARDMDALEALRRLTALRQELGALLATAAGKDANISAIIRASLPEGGAIVAPVVTKVGGKLLLVTAGRNGPSISAIDMPQLTAERLDDLMRGDGRAGKAGGWLGAYKAQHLDDAQWLGAIERMSADLWTLFGQQMDRALQDRGIKTGARIVVLPTAALGLLPLGLARNPGSGRWLGETYEMVQAPSFEALAAASAQLANPSAPSLAAAINPTGDLASTEIEGALIGAHFAARAQLKLDASVATPGLVLEALKGKSYWHFASHGAFDWNDVRLSGLLMRDKEMLTIGRLLESQGSLGRPRLVVLSACETGLYDIERNPDEFVGLPATFMQVGAAGVVGSLWQVDDLATALLMAKFYDLHLAGPGGGLAPPTALRQAQTWLRDSTRAELMVYAKAAAAKAKIGRAKLAELGGALTRGQRSQSSRFAALWKALQDTAEPPRVRSTEKRKRAPNVKDRPFQHPYFWAGFVYTGL